MAQAWSPRTACVVNCPGWSISVEALFYLAFAPAALLLARFGRGGLAATAAVSWLVAILLPLLYLSLDPDGPLRATPESGAAWLLRLKYHPLARLPEFVMGMAAAGLFMRRPQGDARWERLEVAAAGVLVGVLLLSDRIPYPLLHNGLLAPVFALLIYRLARGTGPIATALSGRRLELLGGASYALYILHVPVGSWLTAGLSAAALSPPPLLRFALSAGLSLTAAVLVFRRFEEPARRWVRRVTAPRAQLRPVLAGD